jgi:hypothetical protein
MFNQHHPETDAGNCSSLQANAVAFSADVSLQVKQDGWGADAGLSQDIGTEWGFYDRVLDAFYQRAIH